MLAESERKKIGYLTRPNKIRSLRMKIGSQEDVSDAIGISRIHYGNIEKGIRGTKLETAEKIAQALNTTVAKIFKKEGNNYIAK